MEAFNDIDKKYGDTEDGTGDDDDYYGGGDAGDAGDGDKDAAGKNENGEYDSLLNDPEFQIHAISFAVCIGFLYHVGMIGLFYRFFIGRCRLTSALCRYSLNPLQIFQDVSEALSVCSIL